MNSIERILLQAQNNFFSEMQVLRAADQQFIAGAKGTGSGSTQAMEISFEGEKLGELRGSGDAKVFAELARNLAPILFPSASVFERNLKILEWLEDVRLTDPDVCHWTGIYWKESFLKPSTSTDLLLGPYLGDSTDHLRIPLNRGFCGLALSEERVVNVADVRADSRHIACSLKTRSEIVIPLADSQGRLVAELDIDSNRLAAFTPELEIKLRAKAESFKLLI